MTTTTHREQRIVPYTPEQMYQLVADVERYPEFLPWCLAARIRRREENGFEADVLVGFKMVRETFTSRVKLQKPTRIDTTYTRGPFRHMDSYWEFAPAENGGCRVDFYVEFEFRSKMLQALIGVVFHEAVRRMVGAFEARAHQLYGTGSPTDRSPRA